MTDSIPAGNAGSLHHPGRQIPLPSRHRRSNFASPL